MTSAGIATTPTLEVVGVTKRFGGLTAVDDVSFDVAPGQVLGLIGPNGAGKTTLFNILAGATRPDKGRVTFGGKDMTGLGAAARCESGISRTFQNPRPFRQLSVFDNALVGGIIRGASRARARERAEDALKLVGLWDRRNDASDILPLGQQKRLEIARALATEPTVILLDEPIGGLHPAEIDGLATFIRTLPERGLTVVLIEHNMRVALNTCDRVLVLNFGRLIASGTGAEVSRDPEVIRAYLGDISDEELGIEGPAGA